MKTGVYSKFCAYYVYIHSVYIVLYTYFQCFYAQTLCVMCFYTLDTYKKLSKVYCENRHRGIPHISPLNYLIYTNPPHCAYMGALFTRVFLNSRSPRFSSKHKKGHIISDVSYGVLVFSHTITQFSSYHILHSSR